MKKNLFTPFQIRDCSFSNRMGVSPMMLVLIVTIYNRYAAKDGYSQDIHYVQYGRYALDGFGLIITESVAVEPVGRLTPVCCGIWSDEYIPSYQKITEFAHKHNAKIGIQLSHSGRKGSSAVPSAKVRKQCQLISDGGWEVVGPTDEKYLPNWNTTRALTTDEVSKIPIIFAECAKRSIQSGFDFIEIHGAHGYLINQFLSPLTNKRTDIYGGSFESRLKLLKDIIIEIRKVIPSNMPLFVRLSCEDLAEGGITIDNTIDIVKAIMPLGIDLIDCSSSGLMLTQIIPSNPRFQLDYAKRIRSETGIYTAAVGGIATTESANTIIEEETADVTLIGRAVLRGAFSPRRCAVDLNEPVPPYFEGISWATAIPKHCKY